MFWWRKSQNRETLLIWTVMCVQKIKIFFIIEIWSPCIDMWICDCCYVALWKWGWVLREWCQGRELKSWIRIFAFHFMLLPLIWIYWFPFHPLYKWIFGQIGLFSFLDSQTRRRKNSFILFRILLVVEGLCKYIYTKGEKRIGNSKRIYLAIDIASPRWRFW